jgi:hypothetical protein
VSIGLLIAGGITFIAAGLWGAVGASTGDEWASALRLLMAGVLVFGYLAYSWARWRR